MRILSTRRRTALLGALALTSALLVPSLAGASTADSRPVGLAPLASLRADFDGDGLDDVFAFRYGSPSTQCVYLVYSSGIPVTCPVPYPDQGGDPQVLATATGDFNGDGYDDLVLGEPDWGPSRGQYNVGRVQVYYGGPSGLTGTGYRSFTHRTRGIEGIDPRAFGFGKAVAVGDVNGDGNADLVIGVPGDTANGVPFAGSVVVVPGSPDGLQATGSVRFGQAFRGVPGVPTRYGEFGGAVAAVDVTGDGYADVAASDEGRSDYVSLLRGSPTGVSFTGSSYVDTTRTYADAEDLLTGGDVNGDGYADLIGGSPRRIPGGAVLQMLGGPSGIAQARARSFTENSPGVPRAAVQGDFWGSSLAVGDLNGDGRDDLLAGAPAKTVAGVQEAGVMIMLPGSATGLTGHGSILWSEDSPGFCGAPDRMDWFGNAVMIGHLADPARNDAVISAPFDGAGYHRNGLLTWVTGGAEPTAGQCVEGGADDSLGFVMIGPRQNG